MTARPALRERAFVGCQRSGLAAIHVRGVSTPKAKAIPEALSGRVFSGGHKPRRSTL
ncbi:MAG: hypothetical protein U1E34_09085 [Amaricoccus sp.]